MATSRQRGKPIARGIKRTAVAGLDAKCCHFLIICKGLRVPPLQFCRGFPCDSRMRLYAVTGWKVT